MQSDPNTSSGCNGRGNARVRKRIEIGASEGIRTLDIHLGKVTLYQAELRSLPSEERGEIMRKHRDCKPSF